MKLADISPWLAFVTPMSIAIGFALSIRDAKKKHGSTFAKVILKGWGRIFMILLPIVIYAAASVAKSGWESFLRSPDLSVTAFLVFLMGCHDMTVGISIKHNYPIKKNRIAIVGMIALLGLCTATASVVLVFQSQPVNNATVAWQMVLLITSVLAYFCTGIITKLLEAGYIPGSQPRPGVQADLP